MKLIVMFAIIFTFLYKSRKRKDVLLREHNRILELKYRDNQKFCK